MAALSFHSYASGFFMLCSKEQPDRSAVLLKTMELASAQSGLHLATP
jgi:hypothetical protein